MMRRWWLLVVVCGWLVGCQWSNAVGESSTSSTALPAPAFAVVQSELDRPGLVFTLPDNQVGVIEQVGRIVRIADGVVWLDMTALVADTAPERGLLSATMDVSQQWLYVSYSRIVDNATTIARMPIIAGNADIDAVQEIFVAAQPYANHNGGHIAFGPDGWLYLGLGDGGSGFDPDRVARNPQSLLGKLIRLDVRDTTQAYTLPPGQPVAPDWLPEVVAMGLRNPWRFGFTADEQIWIADVGQRRYEELNVLPLAQLPGADFGWSEREGMHCLDAQQPCVRDGLVDPVAEYDHSAGQCSITGGVTLSDAVPSALQGQILYGDFCAGTLYLWNATDGQRVWADTDFQISSFGMDAEGQVYISDYRTGMVYRMVFAPDA